MIETIDRRGTPHTFGPLPVTAAVARSLKSMRYDRPTPIQERSIPVLQDGRDVLAQAQTGTGKTAGFGIPVIETIDVQTRQVQAIVLVPTRELCLQVTDELRRLGHDSGVQVVAVYGGVGYGRQIDGIRRAHVVVGTPGRIEDLLQRGDLNLRSVRFAVLDEADRMLDVGFLPAIERILRQVPERRQTALFSATLPEEVRGLARRHMQQPVTVEVDPERPTVDEIDQRFQRVTDGDKVASLRAYLDDPACYLALVFRRTTYRVDKLARDLSRQGYKVAALHGRRTQGQRERVLADLRSGKIQALIATDIAARGLDIAGLTHVFNFDLPDTPDTYVHRIGRTGRAGETGIAVTFVTPEDEDALRALERYLAGKRAATSPRPSSPASARPRRSATPNESPTRPPAASKPSAERRPFGGAQRFSSSGRRRSRGKWHGNQTRKTA